MVLMGSNKASCVERICDCMLRNIYILQKDCSNAFDLNMCRFTCFRNISI